MTIRAACALALAMPMLLSARAAPPPVPTPVPPIVELVRALERAMPLTPAKVRRLLPPPAGCGVRCQDYPGYPSHYGSLPIQRVDARGKPPFFVVVLGGIGGECVSVARLARDFGVARVENGCTDGATCLAAYAPRAWGRLFFSLPPNGDERSCAREVILNSDAPG